MEKRFRTSVPNDVEEILVELLSKNLISETERNAVLSKTNKVETEGEILKVLNTKDLQQSQEIWRTFSQDSNSDPDLTQSTSKTIPAATNPVLIDLVMAKVFRYLDWKDITTCRSVCSVWNFNAEPLLRQGRVLFGPYNSGFLHLSPFDSFQHDFRDSQTDVPFQGLRLTRFENEEVEWTPKILKPILLHWKDSLEELIIYKIPFSGTDLDVASLLVGMPLKILNVDCSGCGKLNFSLKYLSGIPHLKLRECRLEINEGDRLFPLDIEISSCSIVFQTEELKTVNNFIDFTNLKEATFCSEDHYSDPTQRLRLDFSEVVSLDFLQLRQVFILHWPGSQWKIKHFRIYTSTWELWEESHISLKHMEMREYGCICVPDRLFLPRSIEKLSIYNSTLIFDGVPNLSVLPNLTHLVLSTKFIEKEIASLKDCHNLVSLEIIELSPLSLPVSLIPTSVRNMSITGWVNIRGSLEEFDFEKFVFNQCPTKIALHHLPNIRANEIVVSLNSYNQVHFEKSFFPKLRDNTANVLIGRFDWEKQTVDFAEHSFHQLVDEKAEYFSFKGNRGIPITKEYFEEAIKL